MDIVAEPGPRSVKLYSSSEINNLISDPRAASPLAADDFEQMQKILIGED
jgi:hypothetical protein